MKTKQTECKLSMDERNADTKPLPHVEHWRAELWLLERNNALEHAGRLADALEAICDTGRDMDNGGIAITHEAYMAAREALAGWEAGQK